MGWKVKNYNAKEDSGLGLRMRDGRRKSSIIITGESQLARNRLMMAHQGLVSIFQPARNSDKVPSLGNHSILGGRQWAHYGLIALLNTSRQPTTWVGSSPTNDQPQNKLRDWPPVNQKGNSWAKEIERCIVVLITSFNSSTQPAKPTPLNIGYTLVCVFPSRWYCPSVHLSNCIKLSGSLSAIHK